MFQRERLRPVCNTQFYIADIIKYILGFLEDLGRNKCFLNIGISTTYAWRIGVWICCLSTLTVRFSNWTVQMKERATRSNGHEHMLVLPSGPSDRKNKHAACSPTSDKSRLEKLLLAYKLELCPKTKKNYKLETSHSQWFYRPTSLIFNKYC